MLEKKGDTSRDPKGANSLARALSQWKEKGSVEDEEQIIECLGMGLIKAWDDLPRDIQRQIFDAAAGHDDSGPSDDRKEHLARFLHSYAN
jgi:hypothetical protein